MIQAAPIWLALIFGGPADIVDHTPRSLAGCLSHASATIHAHPTWSGLCITLSKTGAPNLVVRVNKGDRT